MTTATQALDPERPRRSTYRWYQLLLRAMLFGMPEKRPSTEPPPEDLAAVSTKAEAGLYSEAAVIEEQARQVQPLKKGENLLPGAPSTTASKKPMQEPATSRKGPRE
jgi:hypothetical protein